MKRINKKSYGNIMRDEFDVMSDYTIIYRRESRIGKHFSMKLRTCI